jgi:hypothetical protein
MLSLSKIFTKQPLNLMSECFKVTSKRNIFSHNYFGLEAFKKYAQLIQSEQGRNLESLKMTIEQSLAKPDSKIFTEDLKTLLYLTKGDSDLDLLLRALKKYRSQESLAIFNFNFESPLVKLLIELKKTDKALEIFGPKGDFDFAIKHKPRMILMNHFLEEKRYNEVFQLANLELETLNESNKEGFPSLMITNIVGHAALELNTAEAFSQAKELFAKISKLKLLLNRQGSVAMFLLALQHNDFEYAYNVASNSFEGKPNKNLKIIAYVKLNRLDEALTEATNLSNEVIDENNRRRPKFNSLALEELTNAVQKSGDDNKMKQLDDIKAKIGDRMDKLTLREYAITPIERQIKNNFGNQNRNNFGNRNRNNENRDEKRNFNNDDNNNRNQRNFQRGDGFRRNNENNQNNNNRYNRSNNQRVSFRNENE